MCAFADKLGGELCAHFVSGTVATGATRSVGRKIFDTCVCSLGRLPAVTAIAAGSGRSAADHRAFIGREVVTVSLSSSARPRADAGDVYLAACARPGRYAARLRGARNAIITAFLTVVAALVLGEADVAAPPFGVVTEWLTVFVQGTTSGIAAPLIADGPATKTLACTLWVESRARFGSPAARDVIYRLE